MICFDPFHVVKLATDALQALRRQVWQAARALPDKRIAKTFKGARWALLKNPGDLADTQAQTLREMKPLRWDPVARLPAQGGSARDVLGIDDAEARRRTP